MALLKSRPDTSRRRAGWERLILDVVGEFFDDGIGEDFAGDALDLGAGFFGGERVGQSEGEVLALTDGGDAGEADLAQSVVDGLALRIEDRCL